MGDDVVLRCGDVISNPPAKLEWFKSGIDYKSDFDEKNRGDRLTGSIKRSSSKIDNGDRGNSNAENTVIHPNFDGIQPMHDGSEFEFRTDNDSEFGFYFCRASVHGFPIAYKEFLVGKRGTQLLSSLLFYFINLYLLIFYKIFIIYKAFNSYLLFYSLTN